MKRSLLQFVPAAACLVAGGLDDAMAATPLPSWYGEANTTRQGYTFGTGSLTPAPDVLENPYGTPVATVVLGTFSDGWQDPLAPYDLAGVNDDGAWDLGKAGTINVTSQIASHEAAPGTTYQVDFEVYTVAYLGITALPLFDSLGLSANDLTLTQNTVANDPLFPGASWQGLKWTGNFTSQTSNTISFLIKAPANNTSVIDTLEVFTRVTVIPEPSAFLLVFAPAAAWVVRRRRG